MPKKAISENNERAEVKVPQPSSQVKSKTTKDVTSEATAKTAKQPIRVKDLDPNMYITVRNGFQGILNYRSRRTGQWYVWGKFGDEQEMELFELRDAKNQSIDYYKNNWFLIDDPDILDWLGVSRYYEYALDYDGFDKLFEHTSDEIAEIVKGLSGGQKMTLAYKAKQMISNGEIDSMKTIAALEEGLGRTLIER